MESICNQAGRQVFLSQLFPKKVEVPRQHQWNGISQMSGKGCTRFYGLIDLLSVRKRMAYGNQNAVIPAFLDKFRGIFPFGSKGDQLYPLAGSVLKLVDQLPRRLFDVFFAMGATCAIKGGKKGAFQMNPDYAIIHQRVFLTRPLYRG